MKRRIGLCSFMEGLSEISNDSLVNLLIKDYQKTERRTIQAAQYLCVIVSTTHDEILQKLILATCDIDKAFVDLIIESSEWSSLIDLEMKDKRESVTQLIWNRTNESDQHLETTSAA